MTTLITSNDLMKVIESLNESALLIKSVRQIIKNEIKEQKDEFLGMLLSILAASLLENLLTGKRVTRADTGAIRAG